RSDSGRHTETPRQGDIVSRMKWQRLAVLSAPVVMLAVILGSASFPWAQTPARQAPAPSSAPLQAIVNQIVALFPRVSGDGVEGLGRSGRIQVAMGDHVGVWVTQQGIKPDEFLEGKGLSESASRFKVDNLLALHFKTVDRKPYVDARFFALPSTTPVVASATFVPPSVRTAPRERFSSGGDRLPPQAKQRSLLARILGGELEAGSYSSGENSIPLKEIGRFAFPVVAMDVSVSP